VRHRRIRKTFRITRISHVRRPQTVKTPLVKFLENLIISAIRKRSQKTATATESNGGALLRNIATYFLNNQEQFFPPLKEKNFHSCILRHIESIVGNFTLATRANTPRGASFPSFPQRISAREIPRSSKGLFSLSFFERERERERGGRGGRVEKRETVTLLYTRGPSVSSLISV